MTYAHRVPAPSYSYESIKSSTWIFNLTIYEFSWGWTLITKILLKNYVNRVDIPLALFSHHLPSLSLLCLHLFYQNLCGRQRPSRLFSDFTGVTHKPKRNKQIQILLVSRSLIPNCKFSNFIRFWWCKRPQCITSHYKVNIFSVSSAWGLIVKKTLTDEVTWVNNKVEVPRRSFTFTCQTIALSPLLMVWDEDQLMMILRTRGGRLSSITQILSLANPCWSSDPQSIKKTYTQTTQLQCSCEKIQ